VKDFHKVGGVSVISFLDECFLVL